MNELLKLAEEDDLEGALQEFLKTTTSMNAQEIQLVSAHMLSMRQELIQESNPNKVYDEIRQFVQQINIDPAKLESRMINRRKSKLTKEKRAIQIPLFDIENDD